MHQPMNISFDIGDNVTCCVYGDGLIVAKQPRNQIDKWFDGTCWLQAIMPKAPYKMIYFDISGRCAEEGDWLVNYPTLFHKEQYPVINVSSDNRPFYLGEHVVDLMWGRGIIIAVDWTNIRPFRVVFDEYPYKHHEGYPQSLLYRPNGTRMQMDQQRLFHEDQYPTIITREKI